MRRFFEVTATCFILVGLLVALLLTFGGSDSLAYFIFIIFPVLLVATVASYFTVLICRAARWRRRRLHWHFGLLGAVAACILAICVVWLGLSLQSGSSWGVCDIRPALVWVCISGSALGVLPSEVIVWHYQRRFKDENHVF